VKLLQWFDRMMVVISVTALVVLTAEVCVSVIGRYLFSAPIPDDLVISEFLMVFIVFLPLSSIQAAREHVFVTIFTEWMPNNIKAMLETFGVFIGLIGFSIIAVATYADFKHAWDYGSYVTGLWELVEWPAKFAVFAGIALFAVRLLVDFIQSIAAVIRGTATATKPEEDRVLDGEL
jgi:TRAP-type C4-dicarboxylate transport system permease small subunit